MSVSKHYNAATKLHALRAWRLFLIELHGKVYGLDQVAYLADMPLDAALAAIGLSGSAWGREHWRSLYEMFCLQADTWQHDSRAFDSDEPERKDASPSEPAVGGEEPELPQAA